MSWQQYEEDVFQECQRIFRETQVIKNTYIIRGRYSNVPRQIDVLVQNYLIDGTFASIMIDAKNYSTKVDVKCVESFIAMLDDVNIPKGILVTNKGFTEAAINRAHFGTNDIEVEILNMDELGQFQSTVAIPYSGQNGIVLPAPFGWIIDGKYNGFSPAALYPRGFSFEEAMYNKEWIYIQFWDKNDDISTIPMLIENQNQILKLHDPTANIEIIEQELFIRKARLAKYPTIEITIFKEFEAFILFGVLYCPDYYIDRDIKKLKYVMQNAIPLHITRPAHRS